MGVPIVLSWLGNPQLDLGAGGIMAVHAMTILIFPMAATCWVAFYSWPHWKAVIVTALVPAILIFLVGYTNDIRTAIESAARNYMNHTLGYVSPFNVFGQVGKALPLLLWAAFIGATGLYLKRIFVGREPLGGEETESFFTPFLRGLVVLVALGLIIYSIAVSLQNTDGGRVASARKVLLSPESAEYQRSSALLDMLTLRTDGSTDLLRMAAANQPPPINILAAGLLAERNDISALPLLESHLMLSSTLKGQRFEWNVGRSLREIKDPKAVPALIRLLKSSDSLTRQEATLALRTIGGDAVLDPLVAGLSDPDQKTRWLSVMGLAETVGRKTGRNERYPRFDEFKADEKPHLDHWREWAAGRSRE
jgi:hypothetical protein